MKDSTEFWSVWWCLLVLCAVCSVSVLVIKYYEYEEERAEEVRKLQYRVIELEKEQVIELQKESEQWTNRTTKK